MENEGDDASGEREDERPPPKESKVLDEGPEELPLRGARDSSDDVASAAPRSAHASTESAVDNSASSKGGGGRWWAILAVIMLVELYVYGSRGEVEVCVGKQGVHDFGLRGQARDDANRWKFPRCESRMNLGLRSHHDQSVEEAVKVACRGATLFRNRGEGQQCIERQDGWEHHLESRYVWPWDARFYQHLFWFLQ